MRLKAKDISDLERDQHSEWINESPDHQKAYRDLNQQWDEMDELTPWALDEVKRLQSRFESETNESQGEHYSLSRKLRNLSSGKRRKCNLIGAMFFALAITSMLSAVFISTPWPWLHTKINYETKIGEQRKVVLPDGSLLHLNTGTSVEIDFSAEVRNVELIKGEALFNVVQASNRPFVVDVIDHNVVAVGTTFNLQITDAALKIEVVEGQVAVRHQDAIFMLSAVFISTPWPWLHTKINYETKIGEQRKVVLPDGSLLHLNTGTSVEIDFSAEVRNVELIKGEALFNVVQASNRPFVVDVIDHNVVAVGTTFNLQITDTALKI